MDFRRGGMGSVSLTLALLFKGQVHYVLVKKILYTQGAQSEFTPLGESAVLPHMKLSLSQRQKV